MESKPSKDKPLEPPEGEALDSSEGAVVVGPTAGSPNTPPSPVNSQPPKDSIFRRMSESRRLYAWLFLIVVIMSGVVVFLTVKWARNSPAKQTPSGSLSAQQLAALANSTTTVGDSSQTLSVQSNAVFAGQVLLRQSLEVAGSIKIGGSLSLPSITVGGASTFGQLVVNNTLSVVGDTTIQGQLNVQKNLTVTGAGSFGSLSASQINVTSLQLNGDFTVSRHIIASGGVPSRTNGPGLGGGGTTSVSGSDTGGTVTINTGSGAGVGCLINILFAQKFNTTPHVVISPSNSAAAGLNYYTTRSTTGFSVCSASAPADAATYVFDYVALD